MFSNGKALLERTGYTLDVTTGQRKYGGPPPESAPSGAQPTIGTEVKKKTTCNPYVAPFNNSARMVHFSYVKLVVVNPLQMMVSE